GRRRVEDVAEPLPGQPAGQLDPDHPLPEAEHLGVVAEHRTLHRERVVRGHGADPGHLVGADRDAEPGAADQQRTVGLALGDQLRRGDGDVRVGGVLLGGDPDVDQLADPVVGVEVGLQDLLVLQAGIVTADHDPPLRLTHRGALPPDQGIRLTLIDLVPSPTRSSPCWKSASGSWWVQIFSIGSAPEAISRIAAGQVCGPRWAPRTFSSLSSLMIDQSTVTSSRKTPYST